MTELGELIHAPPTERDATPPVDAVRAFVFLSGVRWIKEHGYDAQLQALMPESLIDMRSTAAAGDWLPVAEARLVYAALDQLGLSVDEQMDLGKYVAMANNGVIVNTIARLSGKLGLTPWPVLARLHGLWLRNNRGGAVAIYKLAERSARLEFRGVPFADSSFFRTSLCGSLAGALEPFAANVRVNEMNDLRKDDEFSLRVVW